MNRIALFVGSVLLALIVLNSTLFVVDQRQVAVIYALGEIKVCDWSSDVCSSDLQYF